MPIVPLSPSPQLDLQTTWGWVGCAIVGITTGTDITELVIHHVWHWGYFRKYCFGTSRNNYIKVGARIASEGGHADNSNASDFFLYCNATYVLYMSLAIHL